MKSETDLSNSSQCGGGDSYKMSNINVVQSKKLINSPFQNPIFSRYLTKIQKRKEGTNLFQFFIRKLSGNSRKLKKDFELQALNQSSLEFLFYAYKGQLISKCPYEKSVSSKIPTKMFLDFCPEFFCSFLGASWKLFGASWGLSK
jgi:hypothetical protein